jgi:hypothetical protein
MKPYTSWSLPAISGMPGIQESLRNRWVETLLLPLGCTPSRSVVSRYATNPPAMAFNMIVEMTSLTPRVTLSRPAIAAQAAPTTMAVITMSSIRTMPGSQLRKDAAPSAPASIPANRYWPSTPMLNRPIRKPMATATAAM